MKKIGLASLAGIVVASGFSVQPAYAVAEFGGGTFLTIRDCSAIAYEHGCVDPITGRVPPRRLTVSDGGMELSPESSGSLPGLGSVTGSVEFNGPAALPVIRGTSFSSIDSRIGSNVWAIQTYTWTGDVEIDVPLVGTLDFTRTASAPWTGNGAPGGAVIGVHIMLFDPSVIDPAGLWDHIFSSGLSLECGDAGVSARGFYDDVSVDSNVSIDIDMRNGCDGNPFSVAAGGSFGVAMFQQLITNRGGLLDASHTFELTFAPDADPELVAALVDGLRPASVPEPATLGLFGLGLVGLGLRRRKTA